MSVMAYVLNYLTIQLHLWATYPLTTGPMVAFSQLLGERNVAGAKQDDICYFWPPILLE